jgi:hypothetical protein
MELRLANMAVEADAGERPVDDVVHHVSRPCALPAFTTGSRGAASLASFSTCPFQSF